jgi:hypothetical protein
MSAPNIVNVTSIAGKTAVLNVTTTATALVTNPASSGKVFKINMLLISNVDGTNACDITAVIVRDGTAYALASTITIPADASLVVISKDTCVYLEETDFIRLQASANSDLQAVCSYEEIS